MLMSAVALLIWAGCAGPHVAYTPLIEAPGRSSRPAEGVEMYMKESPPTRATRIVGRLQVQRPSFSCYNALGAGTTSEETSIRLMRERAAEVHADGIRDIDCAGYGTVGAGYCTGSAFVYEDARQ